MSVESIYNHLAELIDAGETVAVATIIEVKGSVPREVGAKMIIHPLGRHVGTVGGGCGEADVMRAALDVIQTGEPATVRVDLTEDVSMQALGVCGGILDVFVERVGNETKDEGRKTKDEDSFVVGRSSFVAALLASIHAREPVALATVVSGPSAGREAVVWLDKPPLGDLGLGDLAPQVIADAQEVLRGRQHKLLKYEVSSTLDASRSTLHVFVEVQRRSPGAADRRRRAYRRPAGADGEHVRFRGHGARRSSQLRKQGTLPQRRQSHRRAAARNRA